jgi:NADPH:quinone reductase-like Zn-dependent oxidoreductase
MSILFIYFFIYQRKEGTFIHRLVWWLIPSTRTILKRETNLLINIQERKLAIMSEKILVTGATGNIGSYATAILKEKGVDFAAGVPRAGTLIAGVKTVVLENEP